MEYDERLLVGFSHLKKVVGAGAQASVTGAERERKVYNYRPRTQPSTERRASLHTCKFYLQALLQVKPEEASKSILSDSWSLCWPHPLAYHILLLVPHARHGMI